MKKLIITIFSFQSLFLLAVQPNDTVVSKHQIIVTENKLNDLENKLKKNEIDLKEANSSVTISKQYAKTADDLVNNWTKLIAILLSIAGVTGFFGIKSYVKTSLEKILNQKEEIITELFDKHELEKGIITKSKILIINNKKTDLNMYLENVLNKFSKKIVIEHVDDLKSHSFANKFQDFDLVLFENTNTKDSSKNWDFRPQKNEQKDTELKLKLVEIAKDVCNEKVAFFFFGSNDDKFVDSLSEYAHLINFSNSPSTAYSNIINLLNFRELLKKS